ncbi:hypothetical protein ACFO1S_03475 [Cohnella boryungensis]|uniref:Uncharacterized protein n=1 Tax=Cohnella boryungensis TaxID=768479 RepID=A0ABV8S7M8_9BACL
MHNKSARGHRLSGCLLFWLLHGEQLKCIPGEWACPAPFFGCESKFYRGDAKRQLHREIEFTRGIHRLQSVVIVDEAIDEIYRFASGSARMINKVCTHGLLYGAQNTHRIIDDHMTNALSGRELS